MNKKLEHIVSYEESGTDTIIRFDRQYELSIAHFFRYTNPKGESELGQDFAIKDSGKLHLIQCKWAGNHPEVDAHTTKDFLYLRGIVFSFCKTEKLNKPNFIDQYNIVSNILFVKGKNTKYIMIQRLSYQLL